MAPPHDTFMHHPVPLQSGSVAAHATPHTSGRVDCAQKYVSFMPLRAQRKKKEEKKKKKGIKRSARNDDAFMHATY
jgi:hypothetical protein